MVKKHASFVISVTEMMHASYKGTIAMTCFLSQLHAVWQVNRGELHGLYIMECLNSCCSESSRQVCQLLE